MIMVWVCWSSMGLMRYLPAEWEAHFFAGQKEVLSYFRISRIGKKLSMQQKLLQKLKEQGCHVDVYLENREGALVSKDKDSIPIRHRYGLKGGSVTQNPKPTFWKVCGCWRRSTGECSFLWKKTTRQGILKKNISGTIRKCGRSDVLSGKRSVKPFWKRLS